jgi:hypothetical protein
MLAVIAGITLFCGSIYVLLGTSLGARLGFLIAFTALMGFMVLLTSLWMTTASPLNTLKGRIPSWKVKEAVARLDESKISQARAIDRKGHTVDPTEASNVKAAVDTALVTKVATPTEPVTADENKYAQFDDVTQYTVDNTLEVGGSNPQFWKLQLHHTPKFAVVHFCEVVKRPADAPFGLPPLTPTCSTSAGAKQGYLILERDLGSLRVPPFVAFVMALTLFVLGLLGLHWREKDEMAMAAARGATTPVPVNA